MHLIVLLIGGLLLASGPAVPAWADDPLPAGVVNVALAEFGDRVGAGSDYGLANAEPVEVGPGVGRGREVRIVRTPRELRLSRLRNEARFQVRVGKVEALFFWIETPPVHGQWHVSIASRALDGGQEQIYSADVHPMVIQAIRVPPQAVLDVKVSSVEQTFRLSKRFLFTVSPVQFALWPEMLPVPYREYVD
jgi:hypothetical protein